MCVLKSNRCCLVYGTSLCFFQGGARQFQSTVGLEITESISFSARGGWLLHRNLGV